MIPPTNEAFDENMENAGLPQLEDDDDDDDPDVDAIENALPLPPLLLPTALQPSAGSIGVNRANIALAEEFSFVTMLLANGRWRCRRRRIRRGAAVVAIAVAAAAASVEVAVAVAVDD